MHNFLNNLEQFYQLQQQKEESTDDQKNDEIQTKERQSTLFQSSGNGLFGFSFLMGCPYMTSRNFG